MRRNASTLALLHAGADVYQNLMATIPGAFERVQLFGKVSLVCDNTHYVLYNFVDPEQAGQAFAAAGGSGPVKGISNSCSDGGVVKQPFPTAMKADALAYFGTTAPQESDSGLPAFPLFCPNRYPFRLGVGEYSFTRER